MKANKTNPVPLKNNSTVPSIPTKDTKILWARAAGRCSMPRCQIELTMEKLATTDVLTYGEMCHIIGEKEGAARGKSTMPFKDRNAYHNLILLCANHHKQIDADSNKYPVEVLHQIKVNHEQWVVDSLTSETVPPDDYLYTALIDFISTHLQLDQWDWFMNNAVRQILHESFIEGYDALLEKSMSIDFPGTKPEIEEPIKNVMSTFNDFVGFFLKLGSLGPKGLFLKASRDYKRKYQSPDYEFYSERHDLWARKCYALLSIYTARVNEFAKAVRKVYNPMYYILRGKFLVYDDLGTHNGGESVIINVDLDLALKRVQMLDSEIAIFTGKYNRDFDDYG